MKLASYMRMKKNLQIIVSGDVQSVSFRYHALLAALPLKLTGWAANMPNGQVMIEAEGDEASLNKLLEWCRIGPPGAKVLKVLFTYSEVLKNYRDFSVVPFKDSGHL